MGPHSPKPISRPAASSLPTAVSPFALTLWVHARSLLPWESFVTFLAALGALFLAFPLRHALVQLFAADLWPFGPLKRVPLLDPQDPGPLQALKKGVPTPRHPRIPPC